MVKEQQTSGQNFRALSMNRMIHGLHGRFAFEFQQQRYRHEHIGLHLRVLNVFAGRDRYVAGPKFRISDAPSPATRNIRTSLF